MRRALELAAAVRGTTSPNPSVGAVVLGADGHTAVGEGGTAPPGGPHAEVSALRAAGDGARGGTAVLTLEPCNHHGRTPPCTQALLAAGVGRVVYAVADPVHGGGAAELAAAGVDVEAGLLAEQAGRVAEAWLFAAARQRPFVTLKLAGSLDGRAAAADGTSRWITSTQSRDDAHRLRARVDAVLAGVGTVLADDPALTVRLPDGSPAAHQPLRVVLDSAGRTPPGARVRDGAAPTLVLTERDVPRSGGGLDPHAVLDLLFARGVRHVLVEGGPRVAGGFAGAGLVDHVVAYLAPVLLGGSALPTVAGDGPATLGDAREFVVDDLARTGPDVRVELRPARQG